MIGAWASQGWNHSFYHILSFHCFCHCTQNKHIKVRPWGPYIGYNSYAKDWTFVLPLLKWCYVQHCAFSVYMYWQLSALSSIFIDIVYDNSGTYSTNGGISGVPADNRQCLLLVNRTTFHLFLLLVAGVRWPLSPVNRYDCRTHIQCIHLNMCTVGPLLCFVAFCISSFTLPMPFRVAPLPLKQSFDEATLNGRGS